MLEVLAIRRRLWNKLPSIDISESSQVIKYKVLKKFVVTLETILTLIFLVLIIFFALVLGAHTSYKILFYSWLSGKLRSVMNTLHTTTKSKFSFIILLFVHVLYTMLIIYYIIDENEWTREPKAEHSLCPLDALYGVYT